jgi:hypothetical protein
MNDRGSTSAPRQSPIARDRRPYTAPALVRYGSIAKLTQTGGSTSSEGTVPAKAMMCL